MFTKAKILPGSGVDLAKFKNKKNLVKNKNTTKFLIASKLLVKGIRQYYEAAFNQQKI